MFVGVGYARAAGPNLEREAAGTAQEQEAEPGRLDQNTLRKFQRDLKRDDADGTVVELAQAIKALPYGANKEEKFRKLVVAFQKGGAAEVKRKFQNTELLKRCTSLQSAEKAVPYTLALGRWFAGDRTLFAEALANGDVAEVEAEDGRMLYSYVEHSRIERTAKQTKVEGAAGQGLDSVHLEFGWQRTGRTAASSKAPLALTDKAEAEALAEAEEESHNAKPPVGKAPTAEAQPQEEVTLTAAQTWNKVDDAVKAGYAQTMKARRALKGPFAVNPAMQNMQSMLAQSLPATEKLLNTLVDMNIDRDANSLKRVQSTLRSFHDALAQLQSVTQVVLNLQGLKKQ